MLELEPGMMIWTWLTFAVLFLILAKVAWKPISQAVEAREKNIEDSIRKAENARAEAEKLMQEQQQKLAGAQDEIQAMLKESKAIAEKMKTELLEKARSEAEKLHQRAQADLEREKDAAILELKKQVADLSIYAATRLIQEKMDDDKHRHLIDTYIKELDQLDKV